MSPRSLVLRCVLPSVAHAVLLVATTASAADRGLTIEGAVLRLVDDSQATALSAGVVTEVLVQEGVSVARGQLLARIDDAEQVAAVATANAELHIALHAAGDDVAIRYAEKAAEAARAELRRSQESIERFPKSVSQSQLDVERLAIRRAELEAEKARLTQRRVELEAERAVKRLAAAELLLARRLSASPIDGVVVERSIRTGEWIEPGRPAFRVVATDRLRAEGFAPGSLADASLVGRSVRVITAAANAANVPTNNAQTNGPATDAGTGVVSFVSPEIDPVSGQSRVVVLVDNAEGRLRAGSRCRLVIDGPSTDDLNGKPTSTPAETLGGPSR